MKTMSLMRLLSLGIAFLASLAWNERREDVDLKAEAAMASSPPGVLVP
jgi:hypothetical protein